MYIQNKLIHLHHLSSTSASRQVTTRLRNSSNFWTLNAKKKEREREEVTGISHRRPYSNTEDLGTHMQHSEFIAEAQFYVCGQIVL